MSYLAFSDLFYEQKHLFGSQRNFDSIVRRIYCLLDTESISNHVVSH